MLGFSQLPFQTIHNQEFQRISRLDVAKYFDFAQ